MGGEFSMCFCQELTGWWLEAVSSIFSYYVEGLWDCFRGCFTCDIVEDSLDNEGKGVWSCNEVEEDGVVIHQEFEGYIGSLPVKCLATILQGPHCD